MLFCVCFRSCQYNLLESSLFLFSYKKVIPLRNINIDISCQLKMKEFFRWVKSKSLILKSKFIMQCEKNWITKTLPKARIISYLFNVSHKLLVRIEYKNC